MCGSPIIVAFNALIFDKFLYKNVDKMKLSGYNKGATQLNTVYI